MPPQQLPASLGQMAAPNIGADPNAASLQYQGPSLASLATMPNVKQPSKFTAGNILGTLGDALSAYGGKAPTFGPFLREQQMMDKQQSFEMQKYQRQLDQNMFLMRNGLDTEAGKQMLAAGVVPGSQEWLSGMHTALTNSQDPVVMTPQGPMLRSQIVGAGSAVGAPAPAGVTFTPIGGQ